MLLDTAQGLRVLRQSFDDFLASPSVTASFSAAMNGSPAPYDEFLLGLRVSKGGQKQLLISADRWLELSGSPQDLHDFCACLTPKENNHLHWYGKPLSLIIEADDFWLGHEG